jgi:hypothetical protein
MLILPNWRVNQRNWTSARFLACPSLRKFLLRRTVTFVTAIRMNLTTTIRDDERAPTERQQAVLDAVLSLMVEQGGDFSISDVARRANVFEGNALQMVRRPRRHFERHGAVAGVKGALGQLGRAAA